MSITIKYYIWLKTLHFINDILSQGKRIVYFISAMSKLFSIHINLKKINMNGGL